MADGLLASTGRAKGSDERRRNLVRAARELLAEEGSTGFSMPKLAARAGVSLATPYNLFGSKSVILHAVFEAEVAGFHRSIETNPNANPIQRVLGCANLIAAAFSRKPDFYRGLHKSVALLGPSETSQLLMPLGETVFEPAVAALDASDLLIPIAPRKILAQQLSRAFEAVFVRWTSFDWTEARLATDLRIGIALILLGVVVEEARPLLLEEVAKANETIETIAQAG